MFRTRVSWADGAVLLTVLVLALLLVLLPLLLQDSGGYLLVTTENGSRSYPLSEDRKLTVTSSNGYALTLEIRDGKAHVLESDCPDKICMHSGWIGTPGQSVICAPAGVRLLIVKDKGGNADVDFIAG